MSVVDIDKNKVKALASLKKLVRANSASSDAIIDIAYALGRIDSSFDDIVHKLDESEVLRESFVNIK